MNYLNKTYYNCNLYCESANVIFSFLRVKDFFSVFPCFQKVLLNYVADFCSKSHIFARHFFQEKSWSQALFGINGPGLGPTHRQGLFQKFGFKSVEKRCTKILKRGVQIFFFASLRRSFRKHVMWGIKICVLSLLSHI